MTQLEICRKALEYCLEHAQLCTCYGAPERPNELAHAKECPKRVIKEALSAQGEQGTDQECQHKFVSDHGLQPACTKCGKVKDLLDCPFCGEIPDFESDVQEAGSQYAVECPGCNAQGPISEYPDTACDMWDFRSSAPSPAAQESPK